jgi:hypothetical protein
LCNRQAHVGRAKTWAEMNNYRCHRRTQENGALISGMLTAAERRKPD